MRSEQIAREDHTPRMWIWPMDKLKAMRGDILATTAILAVVAILLWSMF